MSPSVAPYTSCPSKTVSPQVFHLPARVYRSPSTTRRAAAIINANAKSAVVSVSTPGVLPTAIPRCVAAGTSMLSKPTAQLLTTLSLGALSINVASILSVSKESKPSRSCTFANNTSRGGGSSSCQTSASHTGKIRSSAFCGNIRVIKTLGFIFSPIRNIERR